MFVRAAHRSFGSKTIVHGRKMQAGTVSGARSLAEAVASTLGPGGRNVVIDPFKQSQIGQFDLYPKPIITKDGVTVARHIDLLSNRLNNLGARLLIDAAS